MSEMCAWTVTVAVSLFPPGDDRAEERHKLLARNTGLWAEGSWTAHLDPHFRNKTRKGLLAQMRWTQLPLASSETRRRCPFVFYQKKRLLQVDGWSHLIFAAGWGHSRYPGIGVTSMSPNQTTGLHCRWGYDIAFRG